MTGGSVIKNYNFLQENAHTIHSSKNLDIERSFSGLEVYYYISSIPFNSLAVGMRREGVNN